MITVHVSATFLWGVATPFLAYAALWLVGTLGLWLFFGDDTLLSRIDDKISDWKRARRERKRHQP